MDFIVDLPKSNNMTLILVVIDGLKKYTHFMAFSQSLSATMVATVFMDNIVKLHG
jgi:hypothetical protein